MEMDLKRIEKLVWKETLKKIEDTSIEKLLTHVSGDLTNSTAGQFVSRKLRKKRWAGGADIFLDLNSK